jgi:H+/Cl- antiporter ClcA
MSPKSLSALLLAVAILFLVLALATLIPVSSSSPATVSDLGYYTLCPFAPYSTLTLLFVAGLAWVVRRYIDNQRSQTNT